MKYLIFILIFSFASFSLSHEISMSCSTANWSCPNPDAFGCGWWQKPTPLEPMILTLVPDVARPDIWKAQHVKENNGYKAVVEIEAQVPADIEDTKFFSTITISKELAITQSRGAFSSAIGNYVSVSLRYAEDGFSYTCWFRLVK